MSVAPLPSRCSDQHNFFGNVYIYKIFCWVLPHTLHTISRVKDMNNLNLRNFICLLHPWYPWMWFTRLVTEGKTNSIICCMKTSIVLVKLFFITLQWYSCKVIQESEVAIHATSDWTKIPESLSPLCFKSNKIYWSLVKLIFTCFIPCKPI